MAGTLDIYSAVGGCFGCKSGRGAGRSEYMLRRWRIFRFARLDPELWFVSCKTGKGAGGSGFILHTDKTSMYLSMDEY